MKCERHGGLSERQAARLVLPPSFEEVQAGSHERGRFTLKRHQRDGGRLCEPGQLDSFQEGAAVIPAAVHALSLPDDLERLRARIGIGSDAES